MEDQRLIGPQADERPEDQATPDNVRLQDGAPLYHALLDPNALTVESSEVHSAKKRLEELIAIDPDAVLSCQGKTAVDALTILRAIEDAQAA